MSGHDSRAIARANPNNATFAVRFLSGMGHLFWGVRTSLTKPSLFFISVVVIAANLLVYAVLLYLGYLLTDDFVQWAAAKAPAVFRWHWVESLTWWMVVVLWAIICVFLAILLASILTGPLLDMLSERTEKLLSGDVHPLPFRIWPMIYEAWAAVAITVLSILVGLITTVLFFWIPFLGQAIPFCVAALFVSLSFVQTTAVRHKLSIADRVRMLRDNKAIMLGFGAPASLFPFLLVPLLTPALVVGGTRLFLALAANERTPTQASPNQIARLLGDDDSRDLV